MDKGLENSSSQGYRLQETRYNHKCRDTSCKEFDLAQEKKVQLDE